MQQDKTDKQRTLPKQTNMKDNCYRVDGYESNTTESIAAESILCAHLC